MSRFSYQWKVWMTALVATWMGAFSLPFGTAAQLGGVSPAGWCEIRDRVCEPGPCRNLEGPRGGVVLPGPGQFVSITNQFRNFNLTDDGRAFSEKMTAGRVTSGYSFVFDFSVLPEGSEITAFKPSFLPDGPQAVVATRLSGKPGVLLNSTFPQETSGLVSLEIYVDKFGPLGIEFDIRRPGLPDQEVTFIADPIWIPLYERDPFLKRPEPDDQR